ncbi:MAG: 2-C-methyl-D-erythritol 4-phosphate cytidylyltransferase, partial [Treponema sp.]|nr:2-C-methyl-D-erythritol 4-phosphate cytidylyltransferase [Treponema sp.]
ARAFASLPEIEALIVAVPDGPVYGEAAARGAMEGALEGCACGRAIFVAGGATRSESVFKALSAIPPGINCALIHDGARPWISAELILRVLEKFRAHPAVIPLLPLTETPKELSRPLNADGANATTIVKSHLRRALVGLAQTPQAFAFPQILEAHGLAAERALAEGIEFTDDAEIWGAFCGDVAIVPGDPKNRKITFPEDIA